MRPFLLPVLFLLSACPTPRGTPLDPDAGPDAGAPDAACPTPTVTLLRSGGGRIDWHPDGERIAFDRRDPDLGCYDTYWMRADGSDVSCLTCGHPDLPAGRNKGQPAWHPDGRHLVVQVEKAVHPGFACGIGANPGAGAFNDLWALDLQTGDAVRIREIPTDLDSGILHPHFSADGAKLLWSEMYGRASFSNPRFGFGKWRLMIADVAFDASGAMRLENAVAILPDEASGEGWAESHGFSPIAGDRVVFAGNYGYDTAAATRTDIFVADTTGQNRRAITHQAYNEHAFFTKSERRLVFMTGRYSDEGDVSHGTEWVMADADGTDKNVCRLTHFNAPGHDESQASVTTAADLSWSPDGSRFAGYSHSLGAGELIWIVGFDAPQ